MDAEQGDGVLQCAGGAEGLLAGATASAASVVEREWTRAVGVDLLDVVAPGGRGR